ARARARPADGRVLVREREHRRPGRRAGLAVEAGLEGAEVDEVLAGDGFLDRVTASTSEAVSVGVTGVPGWVLGNRLLVLGAQPAEVFAAAFERIGIAPASWGED